jgi:hypothetical protein
LDGYEDQKWMVFRKVHLIFGRGLFEPRYRDLENGRTRPHVGKLTQLDGFRKEVTEDSEIFDEFIGVIRLQEL